MPSFDEIYARIADTVGWSPNDRNFLKSKKGVHETIKGRLAFAHGSINLIAFALAYVDTQSAAEYNRMHVMIDSNREE